MIKSLEIKGFEGHKNTILELHPGINLIIGNSHTGKSSIVKSIKWLSENFPLGDEFINHDMDSCSVKAEFENDIVIRNKSEKENSYKINDDIFDKIDQKVMSKVKKTINFTNYNLQSQFDKFFLLQDSPGEVARKLNEIIDLQIMDKAIKLVKSKVNKKNQDIKYNENEIKEKEKKIKNYDWIEQADNQLQIIEEQYEKYIILNEKIEQLKSYKILIQNYNEQLEKYKKLKIKKTQVKELTKLLLIYDNIQNDMTILSDYNHTLKQYNQQLEKCKQLKHKIHAVNNFKFQFDFIKELIEEKTGIQKLNKSLQDCNNELKKYENLKSMQKSYMELKKICIRYKNRKEQCILLQKLSEYKNQEKELKGSIITLKKDRNTFLSKIEVCPLCKQKINS
jgi:exonuclease SbcC